jgi:hypothetical protein
MNACPDRRIGRRARQPVPAAHRAPRPGTLTIRGPPGPRPDRRRPRGDPARHPAAASTSGGLLPLDTDESACHSFVDDRFERSRACRSGQGPPAATRSESFQGRTNPRRCGGFCSVAKAGARALAGSPSPGSPASTAQFCSASRAAGSNIIASSRSQLLTSGTPNPDCRIPGGRRRLRRRTRPRWSSCRQRGCRAAGGLGLRAASSAGSGRPMPSAT